MSVINRAGTVYFEYSRTLAQLPCDQLDALDKAFVQSAALIIEKGVENSTDKLIIAKQLLKLNNKSYAKEYLRISIENNKYEILHSDAPKKSGCFVKQNEDNHENELPSAAEIRRSNEMYIKYEQGVLDKLNAIDSPSAKPEIRLRKPPSRKPMKNKKKILGSTNSDALWIALRSKA
jgi:hypothetical protein